MLFIQLYTVAKDGAVVIWECSYSLKEMNDYIDKVRERWSTKSETSQDEEEMETAADGVEQGEELQESSDDSMYVDLFTA